MDFDNTTYLNAQLTVSVVKPTRKEPLADADVSFLHTAAKFALVKVTKEFHCQPLCF